MDPAMSIMGDSKISLRVKVDRFGKEESHDSDSVSSLFIYFYCWTIKHLSSVILKCPKKP